MDVDIRRDGTRYTLHFEHGENVGGLKKEPYNKKDTGTKIKWKPDIQVFTDINVDADYFKDIIKRQAIVNAGINFVFKNQYKVIQINGDRVVIVATITTVLTVFFKEALFISFSSFLILI